MATRPALEKIFETVIRGEAILKAYYQYGYTMKEIADHIGVHYTAVSRRLRKQEQGRSTRS